MDVTQISNCLEPGLQINVPGIINILAINNLIDKIK